MLVAPRVTYPGVYIQEVKSDVRTIVGVATATTAFIGRALRGPVDKPVVINSYGDFDRIFGGLWKESSLGYAVRDFFLNGGSQAVIVRLFVSKALLDAQASVTTETKAADDKITTLQAKKEDELDKAKKSIESEADPDKQAGLTKKMEDALAGSDTTSPLGKAVQALTKAQTDKDDALSGKAQQSALGKAIQAFNDAVEAAKAALDVKGLPLRATEPGEWGNKLQGRIDHDVPEDIAKRYGLKAGEMFNLTVRDSGTGTVQQIRNLSYDPKNVRRADKVIEKESTLVTVLSLPTKLPDAHEKPQEDDKDKDIWGNNNFNSRVDTKKGDDGVALITNAFIGKGKEGEKKGLYALEHADIFNLLCIPPYQGDDIDYEGLLPAAISYCEKRRACMLVDPPSDWNSKTKAIAGIASLPKHKNAAVFFPRLNQPNPERDGQMEVFVPCGTVAGIMARTDASRGVWKAPAGMEARMLGVSGLSVPLTDPENGELNPLGVNCLRTMPAAGPVVWGARTLVGDDRLADEWKYIPVRRTALFIEETIYRNIQWAVFEPNDEPLWSQLRLNIGVFMHDLFRQGAFQGQSPKDAYFVKCDATTTTQSDIDKGIVNVVVAFAPLKPAEFVVIYIQQIAGQLAA